jgi:superfamily II DNA/RNA helicase
LELFLDKLTPTSQKMLFSATSSDAVDEVIFEYLNEPEYVSLNQEEITPERIEQHALMCEAPEKIKVLLYLLRQTQGQRSVVFANTRLTAAWLHYKLRANQIPADLITGDLPQNKRVRLIKNLKAGKTNILIATDVASRGLHIPGITHVYNFDLPDESTSYIHRIGRTARAGAQGKAYSLICDCYGENFVGIQELLGKNCPRPTWIENEWLQTPDHAGNPFSSQILRFDPQSKKGFEYDENWEQKKAQQEMEREQRARQPHPQESRPQAPRRPGQDPIEQSYQQRYQQELLRKQEKRSWWVRLVDKVLSFFRPKPKTTARNRPPYGQNRNRPPYNRNSNRDGYSHDRDGRRERNRGEGRAPRRDNSNREGGGHRDRDSRRDRPRDGYRPSGNRDGSRQGGRDHNRPSEGHTHTPSHHQRPHFSNSRGSAPVKKHDT